MCGNAPVLVVDERSARASLDLLVDLIVHVDASGACLRLEYLAVLVVTDTTKEGSRVGPAQDPLRDAHRVLRGTARRVTRVTTLMNFGKERHVLVFGKNSVVLLQLPLVQIRLVDSDLHVEQWIADADNYVISAVRLASYWPSSENPTLAQSL